MTVIVKPAPIEATVDKVLVRIDEDLSCDIVYPNDASSGTANNPLNNHKVRAIGLTIVDLRSIVVAIEEAIAEHGRQTTRRLGHEPGKTQ